jgi:hypothetical protein
MNYLNQMSCIHKQHHHGAKGLEVYATTVACDAKREGDFEGAIVPSGLEVSTEGGPRKTDIGSGNAVTPCTQCSESSIRDSVVEHAIPSAQEVSGGELTIRCPCVVPLESLGGSKVGLDSNAKWYLLASSMFPSTKEVLRD